VSHEKVVSRTIILVIILLLAVIAATNVYGEIFPQLLNSKANDNQIGYVPGSVLTTGLVAYWPLDEGNGTKIYDLSGNSNTGYLANSPSWQSESECKYGNCLNFSAPQFQYVNLGTVDDLKWTANDSITLSIWSFIEMYPSSGNYAIMIGNTEGTTREGYDIALGQSGIYCAERFAFGVGSSACTGSVDSKQWHNIILTYNGSNLEIYLDGRLSANSRSNGLIPSTVATWSLGANGNDSSSSPGYFWNGKLDDIRIYNFALSPSQVSELYQASPPLLESQQNALIAARTTVLLDSGVGFIQKVPTSFTEVDPHTTWIPIDLSHSSQFLIFEILSSSIQDNVSTSIQYSLNSGVTWSDLTFSYFSTSTNGTAIYIRSSWMNVTSKAQTFVLLRAEVKAELSANITFYRLGIVTET
jgi:hypothetical protein